jgi:hypothetical protein
MTPDLPSMQAEIIQAYESKRKGGVQRKWLENLAKVQLRGTTQNGRDNEHFEGTDRPKNFKSRTETPWKINYEQIHIEKVI